MKISLKNVGMLDEANFEVGGLTIICGENNTGKTYATYSLYGYLDFIRNNRYFWNFYRNLAEKYVNDIEVDGLDIKIFADKFIEILTDFSNFIFKLYKDALVEILAGKDGDFDKVVFEDDIIRNLINFLKSENFEYIKEYFSLSNIFSLSQIDDDILLFTLKRDIGHDIEMGIISAIFNYICILSYPNSFIISAERTGASMFQKELDVNKNEIVEQISMADTKDMTHAVIELLQKRYSRYPKPVKDNIYFIRDLGEVAKKKSFIVEDKNELNAEILGLLFKIVGGKYIVSDEGIEFAPGAKQRITKGKFAIQRASSSVRSLLMLNYYILHRVSKNDILMIDEPELNLHPNNQILIGRLITLLVNAGIKVFITTHSDYIVREISNCIILNNLENEQITKFKKNGYSKEYKLDSKKVRAYLAKNTKGKNTLNPVKINERGIFMETFDDPIDTQNENQELIFTEFLNGSKK